jgi:excisionase family DNA binding protein
LRISPAQTYRLVRQRKLRALHIGRSVRVRMENLVAYIAATRTDRE